MLRSEVASDSGHVVAARSGIIRAAYNALTDAQHSSYYNRVRPGRALRAPVSLIRDGSRFPQRGLRREQFTRRRVRARRRAPSSEADTQA